MTVVSSRGCLALRTSVGPRHRLNMRRASTLPVLVMPPSRTLLPEEWPLGTSPR